MPASSLSIEQVLTLLAETPPRIAAITDGLTSAQLHAAPRPDEWSANDVLAHLRACADVWGGCIRKMVEQDAQKIRTVSPRGYIKKTDYTDQDFHRSFRDFQAQRAALLALVKPLPSKAWSRTAIITGAGNGLEQPMLHFAQRLADHERHHLEQFARIARVMSAKQRLQTQ